MVALRLAKAGYWNGDPAAVLDARVDLVLEALDYEKFTADFESVYLEMNK